jgi:hypothetical protein
VIEDHIEDDFNADLVQCFHKIAKLVQMAVAFVIEAIGGLCGSSRSSFEQSGVENQTLIRRPANNLLKR